MHKSCNIFKGLQSYCLSPHAGDTPLARVGLAARRRRSVKRVLTTRLTNEVRCGRARVTAACPQCLQIGGWPNSKLLQLSGRRSDSNRPVVFISWLGKSYQGPEGLPERGKGCGKRYINIPFRYVSLLGGAKVYAVIRHQILFFLLALLKYFSI